jgi:co-chaperonin GroES (HSP10)
MAVKPTRDNILVTQAEAEGGERTTESGLILTASVETGIKPAHVVAVGPDVTTVEPGSKVYLKWSECTALTHGGIEAALCKEKYVLAIVE